MRIDGKPEEGQQNETKRVALHTLNERMVQFIQCNRWAFVHCFKLKKRRRSFSNADRKESDILNSVLVYMSNTYIK